jgi:hypothetical protein
VTSRSVSRNDEGASLILILGLVVVVSMIMAGLFGFMTTTVRGRVPLDTARNREYAADAAVEYGIARVRSAIDGNGAVCALAPYQHNVTNSAGVTLDPSLAMHVDCTDASGFASAGGFNVLQKNATFAACPDTGAVCNDATVIVRAQVNFQKPLGSPIVVRTFVQSWSVNQ